MNKKIELIAVILIVIGVVGIWVLKNPVISDHPSSKKSEVRVPGPGLPGSVMEKVQRVEGQKIFLTWIGKDKSVTVTADTKIIKQVNNNGFFKDVEGKLSDIKPSQIIEIITDTSGNKAKSIRVLE